MFDPGDKVIIRTVTNYFTGRIEKIDGGFITLAEAAWVADTGRWHQALTSSELSEVEPYPAGVAVALGAIVDLSPWNHDLPTKVK
jgi:hypothetical protein